RRRPVASFRSRIPTPPILCLRFAVSLAVAAQDSRPSGPLLLSRKALSSSTSCRFSPAHCNRDVSTTILSRHCQLHGFHWLASFTDIGFCCTPTENCWQVFARQVTLLCLLRLFFYHWKRRRKRLGKTPSRLRRTCCNSFIPNEAISALHYSTSRRKTKSRSLPTCRGRLRSRCQWLAHRNTGSPG